MDKNPLPVQGTKVWCLVWEDPCTSEQLSPRAQPLSRSPRARAPRLPSPHAASVDVRGPEPSAPVRSPRRKKPEHRSYRKSAQDSEDPAVPKINKAATAARAKKGRHRTKNANAPDATARVKMAETANFVFSILPQWRSMLRARPI